MLRKSILLENTYHRPLLLSLCINATFFTLFFIAATPSFDTNDDTAIMMISSGFLTGEPSEYLIHMSVILGKPLKVLYTYLPGINWYSMLLFSMHFVAMALILYVFLRLGKNLYSILLFFILFAFFETFFLTHLQYTSTGFVVSASGLILFFSTLSGPVAYRKTNVIAAIGLMTFAVLIRFEVIYGIAVMAAPILLLRYLETRSVYVPLVVGLVLAISWGVALYEKNYYSEHGYPNIKRYETCMAALMANPIRVTDEHLKEVNWSRNDLSLLQHWFWIDKETYSDKKVATFTALVQSYNSISGLAHKFYTNIIYTEKRYLILGLICILVICLIPAWFSVADNRTRYANIAVSTMVLVCVGLKCLSRAPPRVMMPLVFLACVISIYFSLEFFDIKKASRTLKVYLLIGFVILLAVQFYKIAKDSRANEKRHREYRQAMRDVNEHRNDLFVLVGTDFPLEGIPLIENPIRRSTFNVLITGWVAHTPAYHKVLSNYSIGNIMKCLYEKKNIYIVGGGKEFVDSLTRFYKEHYDEEVDIDFEVPGKARLVYLKPMRIMYKQGKSAL